MSSASHPTFSRVPMEEQGHCSLPRLQVFHLPAMKPQQFPGGYTRSFSSELSIGHIRLSAYPFPASLYHITCIGVGSPCNERCCARGSVRSRSSSARVVEGAGHGC